MEKRLYLSGDAIFKSKEQTGEHAGGTYVARVQTGIEKDGSPQYRYFRSQADYNKYLAQKREKKKEGKDMGQGKKTKTGSKSKSGKGGKVLDMKERLQAKLKKEQESSSNKTANTPANKLGSSHAKKQSLFSGGKEKLAASLNKSLPLYLGEINE